MGYRKSYAKKSSTKAKRWYVAAKTPFGSFSAGNEKQKRALKNFVRRSVLEKKLFTETPQVVAMTANTMYTRNLLGNITQGTNNENRVGDNVFIKSFKARLTYDLDYGLFPANVSQAKLRVLVVRSREAFNPSGYGSGIGSYIFLNTANPLESMVDFRTCQVVCDHMKSFKSQSGINQGKERLTFDIDCPINKNVQYQSAASFTLDSNNYYIILVAGCFGGVTGTTVMGSVYGQHVVSFTD